MINILERQFDPTSLKSSTLRLRPEGLRWTSPLDSEASRLTEKIKERSSTLLKGLGTYFKRLLFPFDKV